MSISKITKFLYSWLIRQIITNIEIINKYYIKDYKNYLSYLKKSISIFRIIMFLVS